MAVGSPMAGRKIISEMEAGAAGFQFPHMGVKGILLE